MLTLMGESSRFVRKRVRIVNEQSLSARDISISWMVYDSASQDASLAHAFVGRTGQTLCGGQFFDATRTPARGWDEHCRYCRAQRLPRQEHGLYSLF